MERELERLTDEELMRYHIRLYDEMALNPIDPAADVGVTMQAVAWEIERRTYTGLLNWRRLIVPGFNEMFTKFKEHNEVIGEKARDILHIIAEDASQP